LVSVFSDFRFFFPETAVYPNAHEKRSFFLRVF